MPNNRVSMSKAKQVVGALQASRLSVRALGLSARKVSKYLRNVRTAGIAPARRLDEEG